MLSFSTHMLCAAQVQTGVGPGSVGKKTVTFIMGQDALHSEKALCGESP